MGQADREYLAGSADYNVCDRYLAIFTDFKYMRGFWEGDLAPVPFVPDPFTDATHPVGISIAGISVPIQNPFNPFTVADYTSPGGFDPFTLRRCRSNGPPGSWLLSLEEGSPKVRTRRAGRRCRSNGPSTRSAGTRSCLSPRGDARRQ